MTAPVRYIDVLLGIHRQPGQVASQFRAEGRTVVSRISSGSGSRDSRDLTGGIDLADHGVVRKVNIACGIDGECGRGHRRGGRGPSIAAIGRRSRAGECRNHSRRIYSRGGDFSNAIILPVGDVHVRGRGTVEGDSPRRGEISKGGSPAVAVKRRRGIGASGHGSDGAAGIHHPDRPDLIRDIEIALTIGGNADGIQQFGALRRTVVAAISEYAVACVGGYGSAHRDDAHSKIAPVGDVQVSGGVEREPLRIGESGGNGGVQVARIPGRPRAGNMGDRAGRIDHADYARSRVGYIEIALGIQGQAGGRRESRCRGGAAIAPSAGGTAAGDGADGSAGRGHGRDQSNSIVSGIRNIKIAGRIYHHSLRVIQLRAGSGDVIAGVSRRSRAGDRRYDARGCHLANALIALVGNIQIADGV